MPAEAVDGMDVLAVEAATRRAAEPIRRGEGPAFLECRTYRFRAHSMFDAELYRDKSEVEAWKPRDPIATFTRAPQGRAGVATTPSLAALETSVSDEIDQAVRVRRSRHLGTGRGSAEGRLHADRARRRQEPPDATTTYREAIRSALREALAEGPARLPDGRGRRDVRRQSYAVSKGCSPSSAPSGFATRRCRSRRSSAPASAPRSAACGRSSR